MISLIAAIDKNLGLGRDNKLLCHLPSDLKHFKQLTENKIIVMGRKTFESLPIQPLPNRQNIVLTRDKDFNHPEVFVYHSLDDVLKDYNKNSDTNDELMIIGGSQIYKQFSPYADRIYLTIIDNKFDNVDAYFPKLSDEWKPVEHIKNEKDDKHQYNYSFVTYERKI